MDSAYLSEIFVSYQGEGALVGQRHLFVRFAGCNIRCNYCDTPASLVRVGRCRVDYPDGRSEIIDNPISATHLTSMVTRFCVSDPSITMIAITGGEPMVQHGFLANWLRAVALPRPCLLETNATISTGLTEILSRVKVVSADIKFAADTGETNQWQRHDEFLSGCADSGVEVYVKMPVGPATDSHEVRRAARMVASRIPRARLFLQPVTDVKSGEWMVSTSELLPLLAAASAELPRSGLRPQIHKLLGIR